MTTHERIFGDMMLGLLAGLMVWAFLGGLFGMLVRDDLYLIGHPGIRAASYIGGDMPY